MALGDINIGISNIRSLYYKGWRPPPKKNLVALDKSQPVGLKFLGMWNDLEELLGRNVDLVSEGTLLPFAQETAERDKVLIYERA